MSGPQAKGGGARGRPAVVDAAGGAREMDSPRFRAILRATSGRRKRPPDVKSFSHELSGAAPGAMRSKMVRGGGGGGPEELIGAIRTKFVRLKEEVDSELGVFAGDLVGALERGDEPDEERRLALEDLLVAAQRCAEMEGSRREGARPRARGRRARGRCARCLADAPRSRADPAREGSTAARGLLRRATLREPRHGLARAGGGSPAVASRAPAEGAAPRRPAWPDHAWPEHMAAWSRPTGEQDAAAAEE